MYNTKLPSKANDQCKSESGDYILVCDISQVASPRPFCKEYLTGVILIANVKIINSFVYIYH